MITEYVPIDRHDPDAAEILEAYASDLATRKIVVVGWNGWSRPIYKFYDERDAHPQFTSNPTHEQILEQYPNANFSRPAWLEANR